jgi:hypothetical protein
MEAKGIHDQTDRESKMIANEDTSVYQTLFGGSCLSLRPVLVPELGHSPLERKDC